MDARLVRVPVAGVRFQNEMEKKAIILFVRNPVLGEVKTRLAATVGKETALKIYEKLLWHTRTITKDLRCDKYVFYAGESNEQDIWKNDVYRKKIQQGTDLGERMNHAFNSLFALGYEQVMIIGSDCYELAQADLEEAFDLLGRTEILIGPAKDGGYYLLGMHAPTPELFLGITWSIPDVFSETIIRMKRLGRRYLLLPIRNDIDEEEDLPQEWRKVVGR